MFKPSRDSVRMYRTFVNVVSTHSEAEKQKIRQSSATQMEKTNTYF